MFSRPNNNRILNCDKRLLSERLLLTDSVRPINNIKVLPKLRNPYCQLFVYLASIVLGRIKRLWTTLGVGLLVYNYLNV